MVSYITFHEITPSIINKIDYLSKKYTLTFDDGLYSQYFYFNLFKKGYLNICPSFIRLEYTRRPVFDVTLKMFNNCEISYLNYLNKIYNDYMTLGELLYLRDTYDITLCAHSFFHDYIISPFCKNKIKTNWRSFILLKYPGRVREILGIGSKLVYKGDRSDSLYNNFINEDTEKLLIWFYTYLRLEPTIYCYPFNEKSNQLEQILGGYGFTTFFGEERLNVQTVMDSMID